MFVSSDGSWKGWVMLVVVLYVYMTEMYIEVVKNYFLYLIFAG